MISRPVMLHHGMPLAISDACANSIWSSMIDHSPISEMNIIGSNVIIPYFHWKAL